MYARCQRRWGIRAPDESGGAAATAGAGASSWKRRAARGAMERIRSLEDVVHSTHIRIAGSLLLPWSLWPPSRLARGRLPVDACCRVGSWPLCHLQDTSAITGDVTASTVLRSSFCASGQDKPECTGDRGAPCSFDQRPCHSLDLRHFKQVARTAGGACGSVCALLPSVVGCPRNQAASWQLSQALGARVDQVWTRRAAQPASSPRQAPRWKPTHLHTHICA